MQWFVMTHNLSVELNLHYLGERRIRVVTLALPTTTNLSEVYASADQVAIATFLANKAVERSLSHKLEDARDAIINKMVEILTAYKSSMTAAGSGASAQLSISENMRMLPVLLLGLLKNVRGSLLATADFETYHDSSCFNGFRSEFARAHRSHRTCVRMRSVY